jgi:deoxyribodipyrimidine photo-lyase
MRGLVWFREDLRTYDNSALYHASLQCDEGIVALYIFDASLWLKHDVAGCRVQFVLEGLRQLEQALLKLNIPLMTLSVTDTHMISDALLKLMSEIKADALFFNRQYEINEMKRDTAVEKEIVAKQYFVFSYDDQVILKPGSVRTQKDEFFSVFTPFKKTWLNVFRKANIKCWPTPKRQADLSLTLKAASIPAELKEFPSHIALDHWPAGFTAANKRLGKFIENHLFHYDKTRDFPALQGTSQLSPYLAAGMISARQCFLLALDANQQELDTGNKGALTWLSELIWREFYKHILVAAPRVCMHKAYKPATDQIKWNYDQALLTAWQRGETGYPLIDAAMRQLNTLGWMHNRLRMVVAMFLSKNLFLDWRLGEKYFMSHLMDGDLAANNGGWQWSASTGTDAAPYFRIFNPVRQSQRFDPDGQFIRHYCPELADFDNKSIHEPYLRHPLVAQMTGYPRPIIDLQKNKLKVLTAFKSLS